MNTKNLISLLLMGVLSVTTLSAQQHHKQSNKPKTERINKPGLENFKSMKIAYLSEKLALTPTEAEKFWPVYNEFENKKIEARKNFKNENQEKPTEVDLTDADIEKNLNKRFEIKQLELNLEKEYLSKFKSVLSIKKVAELYQAEESFKKDLLRKMRNSSHTTQPQN